MIFFFEIALSIIRVRIFLVKDWLDLWKYKFLVCLSFESILIVRLKNSDGYFFRLLHIATLKKDYRSSQNINNTLVSSILWELMQAVVLPILQLTIYKGWKVSPISLTPCVQMYATKCVLLYFYVQ